MASVRQHRKSRFWYACITLPGGRQKQFSTGLDCEKEALAVAVAAESAARRLHVQPHQLRAALDRLASEYVPAEDSRPGTWLLGWLESRRGTCAPKTFLTYQTTIQGAERWLESRGVDSFAKMTVGVVADLRAHWEMSSSPSTANDKIKHLRIALKLAVGAGFLDKNPAEGIIALKVPRTLRREFRPMEIEMLLPVLHGEWRGMFFLGLLTGQRINDLAILKWSQVDLVAETVCFHASKTGRLVALPLVREVVEVLADLPAGDSPEAFVFAKISKMTPPRRSNAFREILASVGLARPVKAKTLPGGRKTSELSFHSLRHTATSRLKSAGVSDAIARAIIGHESAAVSRSYTHFDMETMRAAMAKCF